MSIFVNGREFADLTQAQDYADWLENHGPPFLVRTPRPNRMDLAQRTPLATQARVPPKQFRPSGG